MDILASVKRLALELSALENARGPRLKEDYGLDSLKLTQLIVRLEEATGIEIDLGLLMDVNLQTVEDVAAIARKSAGVL